MPDLRAIIARNRAGEAIAIPSVCTAHPDALEASLTLAETLDQPIVIEATSNQVNQDGGYTGLKPANFIRFVKEIAARSHVTHERIRFGGDHLGPQAWRKLPADQAMEKAHRMVADYAAAGFTKLHLDCSEGCAGEPAQLPDEITATRSAVLAATALKHAPDPGRLLFVIGTEVPPPGGARTDDHGDIPPTTPDSAKATLAAHRDAFTAARVPLDLIGGLVVQPGVEFSPMEVHHLPLARDPGLRAALTDWPQTCLEAHSTDYQHAAAYPRLAELGFAFQKVGPALTFAWREALYALDTIRAQTGWATGPSLPDRMEAVMLADPAHWQAHIHGPDRRLQRHFGLADRIRYYWPAPQAQEAVQRLLTDLADKRLPDPLLSAHFRADEIASARASHYPLPRALALARVQTALRPYFFTGPRT
ncbi:class II D-tagatose-bisphosphate aldolase non-catalytic subunit [Rhodobacter calidifons]|uniref:Class II D-tagatose-bisphosphate aldolase, non-catalytic subunit n=1 Tax=Rhodobacter calidifons TaxID=2715277 RepID=A0ABX0GB20_9RHOB|nr:class II D-tagatose-bisphosphate aldolase, non-catalytic subunit [Rhodobacter calidifons]NHB78042.1 class II D-tagatose-bisphosphate aldolase, non-catalytic subunit [Rhodobacter calidifons]